MTILWFFFLTVLETAKLFSTVSKSKSHKQRGIFMGMEICCSYLSVSMLFKMLLLDKAGSNIRYLSPVFLSFHEAIQISKKKLIIENQKGNTLFVFLFHSSFLLDCEYDG